MSVVLPPRDLVEHVCLAPPGSFPFGWVFPSLGWMCADVLLPGLYVPGLPKFQDLPHMVNGICPLCCVLLPGDPCCYYPVILR